MDRLDHFVIALGLRHVDGLDRDDVGGPRREQHQLVGEHDRLARIVGDEDRGGRPRLPDFEQEPPQPVGGPLVERHERLVEQQQVGLGGEGAGERHAARQAERQLLRIARQHVGDADGLGEPLEIVCGEIGRGHQLDILLDRPPGQKARLLEHQADAGVGRNADSAGEAVVEAGDDAQQRGLAAARRAHQHRHAFGLDIEDEVADGNERGAVGADVRLLLDADFKPACYASGLNVVQWVAPINIRLPA